MLEAENYCCYILFMDLWRVNKHTLTIRTLILCPKYTHTCTDEQVVQPHLLSLHLLQNLLRTVEDKTAAKWTSAR